MEPSADRETATAGAATAAKPDNRISRRQFVGYVGAAAAAGVAGSCGRGGGDRSVVVLGGGIAGLTVAHELAERGLGVTVYERRPTGLGGKARSIPVPNSGQRPLPGEHGYRTFPGFYQNLPDTMRRIPFPGNRNGVLDNLVAATETLYARPGRAPLHIADNPVFSDSSPAGLLAAVKAQLGGQTTLTPAELDFFAGRLIVFFTSSDARRFGQWEHTSWMDFVGARRFSDEYRSLLATGLTRNLVASKPETASANSIATIAEAFVFNVLGRPSRTPTDRLLNGPTNDTFIDPWVTHLRSLGVEFRTGREVVSLEVGGRRITRAHLQGPGGPETAQGAWFVLAVAAERAGVLLGQPILALDPSLAGIQKLVTDWMAGMQYYLREPVPVVRGHVIYDSPWALTSISQGQFWPVDFPRTYGNGSARDCLSVDIANWRAPGVHTTQKPAWACTPAEIAREVWAQMQAGLAGQGADLRDDLILSWFLDPGIVYPGTPPERGRIADNEDPLVVNTVGAWDSRPSPTTAIDNLFLAGDYVRSSIILTTMEGANETGRRAANAILAAAGSHAGPAQVFGLYRAPELEPFRAVDEQRYRAGKPAALDAAGLAEAGLPGR